MRVVTIVITIGESVEFEWDERKNRENIRKHGLDFTDARIVFDNPLLASIDTREDYGEDRWRGIGTAMGRTVVVIFTMPRPEIARIISFRKATKTERRWFEQEVARKQWHIEEN